MYTSVSLVQRVLGSNFGLLSDGTMPDLLQHIDSAHAVVLRVQACAKRKRKPLTDPELELVERWLAAHFYCQMDPLYMSKGQGGASASFQRTQGPGFESTEYGKHAVRIDYSGCLSAIGLRAVAGGFHVSEGG